MWQLLESRARRGLSAQKQMQEAEAAEELGRKALLAGDQVVAAVHLERAYPVFSNQPALRLLLNSALNQTEGLTYVLHGHAGHIRDLSVDAANNIGGRGALWNLSTLEQIAGFNAGELIGAGDVSFSHDGSNFIVAGSDGLARIFDAAKAELQTTFG